jgi:cyclic pyranopterin monophosphate synthase
MDEMSELSHVDAEGRARMIDVGAKPEQLRRARASGRIDLAESTVELIRANKLKKGDVLTIAEIAGVQAAKRTSELIPLCHPLALTNVKVTATLEEDGVSITAEARCVGRTGVEMEALTAVSVALLTVYDMCKAAEENMRIGEITLLEKTKQDLASASAT